MGVKKGEFNYREEKRKERSYIEGYGPHYTLKKYRVLIVCCNCNKQIKLSLNSF